MTLRATGADTLLLRCSPERATPSYHAILLSAGLWYQMRRASVMTHPVSSAASSLPKLIPSLRLRTMTCLPIRRCAMGWSLMSIRFGFLNCEWTVIGPKASPCPGWQPAPRGPLRAGVRAGMEGRWTDLGPRSRLLGDSVVFDVIAGVRGFRHGARALGICGGALVEDAANPAQFDFLIACPLLLAEEAVQAALQSACSAGVKPCGAAFKGFALVLELLHVCGHGLVEKRLQRDVQRSGFAVRGV